MAIRLDGEDSFLQPNAIYRGDARELLPRVEPNSIACSIWSPPYFVGKSYEEYLTTYREWRDLLEEVVGLHFPIIRPGGFVVINIADILCFADSGMPRIQAETVNQRRSPVTREDVLKARARFPNYNRDQLATLLGCSEQTIDRRLNGNNIRGGKYATQTRVKLVAPAVERWARRAGFYVYDRRVWVKDPCWKNSEWHSSSYRAVDEFEYIYFLWKPGATTVDRSRLSPGEWAKWGSRAAWYIPSVRANDDHEAKFPLELPRRIIRMLTAPGDIVLDCFVGSGTTAVAAIETRRRFIGIDKVERYVEMARYAAIQSTEMPLEGQVEYPEPSKLPFAAAAQSLPEP
ncbi:MAG: site-specific DNA-methyltransferase [Acidobacteriia bacterium]|nr:site-specific DNA-methyltransferase [Terriglobia bacterium]